MSKIIGALCLSLLVPAGAADRQPDEPPAPVAFAAVSEIVQRARELLDDDEAPEEALVNADRALSLARERHDAPGQALSLAVRARVLAELDRTDEALAAWIEAASAWERAGDGPGQIRTLCARALLLGDDRVAEATPVLERAVDIARREELRPLAAAAELQDAGIGFARLRRFGEAVRLIEATVEIRETRAPGSSELAMSLTDLGYLARVHSTDLDAASGYFLRALGIRRGLAPTSADVAVSLTHLGSVARERGDFRASRDYHGQALEIRRLLGSDSLAVSRSLQNLGNVARDLGEFDEAHEYYSRALEIKQRLAPGSRTLAGCLVALGIVEFERGNLEAAHGYYQRVLGIQREEIPGAWDLEAGGLHGLGNVAWRQGDLEAAHEHYLRALAIYQEHAPDSARAAGVLLGLGNVASDRGELDLSSEYLRRTLELEQEHAPGSLALANSLTSLGGVAWQKNDLEAAHDYYVRALEIQNRLAPDSLKVATNLTNICIVSRKLGKTETAHEPCKRALELTQRLAPGSLRVAASLNALGDLVREQGRSEAARRTYMRALEIRERHAPGSLEVAESLDSLGHVARDLGDLERAREYFSDALEIQQKLAPHSHGAAHSFHNLGTVARDRREPSIAERQFARAWEIVRGQSDAVVGDEARRLYGESVASYASDLIGTRIALGQPAAAFEALEESRAQGLLRLLARRGLADSRADPDLLRGFRAAETVMNRAAEELVEITLELQREQRALQRLEGKDPDDSEVAVARDRVLALHSAREQKLTDYTRARMEKEGALAAVKRSIPGLQPAPSPAEEARSALPADSLYVAFAVGEQETHVFLVPAADHGTIEAFTTTQTREALSERVRVFRDRLAPSSATRGLGALTESRRSAPEDGLAKASRELFLELFPRRSRRAVLAAGRLIISPDGPLWELPFAALDAGEGGGFEWLGLGRPISYAQSLNVLTTGPTEFRSQPGRSTGALVLGDPAISRFGKSATLAIEAFTWARKWAEPQEAGEPYAVHRLPSTRDEARAVASLYGAQPLLGEAATESNVRERVESAAVIHLATHGLFLPERAMSSGLLLASPATGEPDGRDDGFLQAWEFQSELKTNADLVVFSACETGRGERVSGEGLVGLTRAVQAAGARTVVATHWPVSDEHTTDLMVAFHGHLRTGVSKDEALRRAMQEAASSKPTSHPFYWAGFFLTGDPEGRLSVAAVSPDDP